MAEYVNKTELIEYINNAIEEYVAQGQNARAKAAAKIGVFVREIPVYGAKEKKSGTWVVPGATEQKLLALGNYKCSECGSMAIHRHNYCPNCGSYMGSV